MINKPVDRLAETPMAFQPLPSIDADIEPAPVAFGLGLFGPVEPLPPPHASANTTTPNVAAKDERRIQTPDVDRVGYADDAPSTCLASESLDGCHNQSLAAP
jgi:hypothetical protein